MSTATVHDSRTIVPCDECRQPVRVAHTADAQRAVHLAPEPVPGGLYALDEHGRAVRHTLVDLYRAERAGAPLAGYDVHLCRPAGAWYDQD